MSIKNQTHTASSNIWMTVAEAATYLRCSQTFLNTDRLTRLHNIPFSRLGRHIRYSVADLDAWLEAQKVQPSADCANRSSVEAR